MEYIANNSHQVLCASRQGWRGIYALVLGLVCLSFCLPFYAHASNEISYNISVYEDTSNVLEHETLLKYPERYAFKNSHDKNGFGISRSAFWFKLDLPAHEGSAEAILEVGYPLLDVVDIYTQSHGEWGLLETGDTRPFNNREIDHRNFLKKVKVNQAQQIFIKVRTQGPSNIPISIQETAEFYKNNGDDNLLMGLYYGVLLAVVLFNLSVYFSSHDKSYLYYVGYIGFIALFLMSLDGLITRFVFPDVHLISSRFPFATLCIAMLSGFKFASSINNTEVLAPRLVKVFNYFSILLGSTVFIGFFIGVRFLTIVTPFLAVLSLGLYIHAIVVGIKSGYKPSIFVGFTFLAIVPGGVFYGIKPFGLIEHGGWLDHAFPMGVAVDAVLLTFVLSYRVRHIQSQLESTRTRMASVRENFSRKLIATRDQERRQLAADLHDGLGQDLLVIKNKLSRELSNHSDEHDHVQVAQQMVQSTIDDVRRMSHELHPHVLDRLGLKDAVIAVIEHSFEGQDYAVDYEVDDIQLPEKSPLALNMYRIVQEGLKNIITHAEPMRVEIDLYQSDKKMMLRMEDFSKQKTKAWANDIDFNQNFGLNSIRERVELLHGDLAFSNNPSGGFKMKIIVPLVTEAEGVET